MTFGEARCFVPVAVAALLAIPGFARPEYYYPSDGTNGWNRASESVPTALGFVPAGFTANKNQLHRIELRSGLTAMCLGGAGNGGGDFKAVAPKHSWRYLSDSQRESNEKRIAERLAVLPPPVPDPSLKPIHWMDDENEPFDERWRILVDFDFDGHDDMLLSEGMREFGNAGGLFEVYRWMDGLYLRIGDVFLHPACLQFEDVRGHYDDEDVDGVRVWSYWHVSACEGSVDGHRIGRFGVSNHETFMAYGCDGESTPGSAALSAILGAKDRIVPFRVQRSETSPDGLVTWKDWDCMSARSIAFSRFSTGVYGYPIEEATRIAIQEVRRFLHAEGAESKSHAESAESAESNPHAESAEFAECGTGGPVRPDMDVVFCCFSEWDKRVYGGIVQGNPTVA